MTKKAKRTSAQHKKGAQTAHVASPSTDGETAAQSEKSAQARTVAAQDVFLESFIAVGNISGACRNTGTGRRTVYNWLETDEAFKARYAEAEVEAVELLEQEARKRAMTGTKPSDLLLIFLLKAARPDKFRERHEHTGKGGGPIHVKKTVTFGGRYKPKPPTKKDD